MIPRITPTEAQIQQATAEWVDLYRRSCPVPIYAFHVPNEGLRTKANGGRLKAAGMKAGVPDWCIMLPGGQMGFIELKTPAAAKTRGSGLSEEQSAFQDRCEQMGHRWALCTSLTEFEATIKGWVNALL